MDQLQLVKIIEDNDDMCDIIENELLRVSLCVDMDDEWEHLIHADNWTIQPRDSEINEFVTTSPNGVYYRCVDFPECASFIIGDGEYSRNIMDIHHP